MELSASARSSDDRDTTPATAVAGVVWDLGNVLIDWQPLHAVAAGVGEDEARRFLAGFDFAAWNHSCDAGRSWDDAIDEVDREHPAWSVHARAYREHFGASLTGEIAGSVALLRELHAAGVPQVGLTNWSSELFHGYAPPRHDFLALLDTIVVSGDEGVAKPEPAIYRLAIERSGLPAERLVFVDDKADNVAAAVALGMRGVVFTGPDALRAELGDLGLPVG